MLSTEVPTPFWDPVLFLHKLSLIILLYTNFKKKQRFCRFIFDNLTSETWVIFNKDGEILCILKIDSRGGVYKK